SRASAMDERLLGSASHGFTAEPPCLGPDELDAFLPRIPDIAAKVLAGAMAADASLFERLQISNEVRTWHVRLAEPTALSILAANMGLETIVSQECVRADGTILAVIDQGLAAQDWITPPLSDEDRALLANYFLEIHLYVRD